MLKYILVILYLLVFQASFSQPTIHEKDFKKAAQFFLIDKVEDWHSSDLMKKVVLKRHPEKFIYLSDTSKLEINIPIYLLRKPSNTDGKLYDSLRSLIDFTPNQYMQSAFLNKESFYYVFYIIKGVRDEMLAHNKLYNDFLIAPAQEYVMTDVNYNFGEKHFDYAIFKEYLKNNPFTHIFTIYNLNGFWGLRDHKLIRLCFTRKHIKEIDGEAFYQKVLLKDGTSGIERVLNYQDFEQLQYK